MDASLKKNKKGRIYSGLQYAYSHCPACAPDRSRALPKFSELTRRDDERARHDELTLAHHESPFHHHDQLTIKLFFTLSLTITLISTVI